MGFFSSKCSKSKISIPAGNTGLPPEASTVVVVTPKGTYEGLYDGYGRVDDMDISDAMSSGQLKWVRKDHYKGETYDQLKPAERCEHQGYFYPDEEIKHIEASLCHNSRDFIVDD